MLLCVLSHVDTSRIAPPGDSGDCTWNPPTLTSASLPLVDSLYHFPEVVTVSLIAFCEICESLANYQSLGWFGEPLELADDVRSEDSLGDPAPRLCCLANSNTYKNPGFIDCEGLLRASFSEKLSLCSCFFSYYLLDWASQNTVFWFVASSLASHLGSGRALAVRDAFTLLEGPEITQGNLVSP